jgi:hypothetical protein
LDGLVAVQVVSRNHIRKMKLHLDVIPLWNYEVQVQIELKGTGTSVRERKCVRKQPIWRPVKKILNANMD